MRLAAAGPPPSDPLVMRPEEVVESYYGWELSYPGNALVERAYRQQPLLDPEFVARLDQLLEQGPVPASPIFCAQDLPTDIDAYPAVIDGDTARVKVTTSFAGHGFEVELRRRAGEWKIAAVHCQPPGG